MRRPGILDVVRAANAVWAARPEVRVWWYAPSASRQLDGQRPSQLHEAVQLELVVESEVPSTLDCDGLAAQLTRQLAGYPVRVRLHRGDERGLYRLVGREAAAPGE